MGVVFDLPAKCFGGLLVPLVPGLSLLAPVVFPLTLQVSLAATHAARSPRRLSVLLLAAAPHAMLFWSDHLPALFLTNRARCSSSSMPRQRRPSSQGGSIAK